MLSVKPAPIRWILRLGGGETDRRLGLEKLQITAEKGHYLKPFARLLLAVAALREHDTGRARDILEELAKEFPHNPLYVQESWRLTEYGQMSLRIRAVARSHEYVAIHSRLSEPNVLIGNAWKLY
jgi:hypothetical protein